MKKPYIRLVGEAVEEKKPSITIPNKKVVDKDTKSFTITLKNSLAKELDKIYKKKGYKSRNELINVILEMALSGEE